MTERACVLDASALLAVVHREEGVNLVTPFLANATLSTVNWCEVRQRLLGRGFDVQALREDVEALGVLIEPFTAEDADRAADLWPATRTAGLSLGDRACIALAGRLGLPALTGDRSWLDLDLGVEIRPIR